MKCLFVNILISIDADKRTVTEIFEGGKPLTVDGREAS